MVGFRKINLFIIAIVYFIPFASFADVCYCGNIVCGAGEYCDEEYPNGDDGEPTYNCMPCQNGQVPNAACNWCVWCGPDYTLTCPGNDGSSTIKCKVTANDCDSVSGCTKYEACNSVTGSKWSVVSNSCHLESGTCYSNERECKNFPIAGGPISNYTPSYTAYWMGAETGWDVSSCKYNINDADFPDFYCKKFNGRSMVTSENRYVSSVTSAVTYTWTHSYCQKCYAGHLPDIIPSPTNGVVTRPGNAGNWGVFVCMTSVTAPNYADGCTIDFSEASGDTVLAACKKSCSVPGHTITQDGATSESQCTIDSSQIYSDNTGRFTIGAGQCSL